jgi:hypothetical protein
VLVQQRWTDTAGIGRTVELVQLGTGAYVVAKCRNDRPTCRESLFYRHLLAPAGVAGTLVPGYLGSGTTEGGVHVLVLEYVPGRAADWRSAADRALAMAALAAFHARFQGTTICDVSPALCRAPLATEAAPDPGECAPPAGASDPLVLDPGDVRPENFVLVPGVRGRAGRAVILDFENARVRRRSAALASMLHNCGQGGRLADQAIYGHGSSESDLRGSGLLGA